MKVYSVNQKSTDPGDPGSRTMSMVRERLVFAMKVGATIMAGVIAMTGCVGALRSNITEEGNFSIAKNSFTGQYQSQTLASGYNFNILNSIFEIYGKEALVKIEDVKPKDSEGIMLKDLDLNIAIKVNRDNAVEFLLKTGDIVYEKEKGIYILGKNYIEKEARSVASQTIRKFTSEDLIDRQQEVEMALKDDLQSQLNTLYGRDTFTVTDTKIANVQFADSVEAKIASIQEINAEQAKAQATKKIIAIRAEALSADAQAYQGVAKSLGWNVNQLMDFQKTQAMISGKFGGSVQIPLETTSVRIPAAPVPAPGK